MKKIIILIITIFLLSGCSYRELNDLAIISAIGIDYDNNEFKLTAQVMNVKSSNSGIAEEESLIYESTGPTIAKAIRNFSIRYPKNAYLGHLELIVINIEAAEQKLDEIFDYFIRSPEARSSSFVVIAKEQKANEILNPNNENKGNFPIEGLKTVLLDGTKRNGTIYDLTFEEFLSFYLKEGIDPLVPLIKITKNKGITASATIIEEMAPVQHNKVLKTLNQKQSIAYNTINNNYYDIIVDCKYQDKDFAAIVYNPKSEVNVELKNNKITVNIDINIESKITEIDSKINLTNKQIQNSLKKEVDKQLKNYITSLIDYCKENNSDIIGIGNKIYKNYFKEYPKYKNKNLYEIADFNIKINNKMYRYGNINKGAA